MADIISICEHASLSSVSAALNRDLSTYENKINTASIAVDSLNNIATTSLLNNARSLVEKEGVMSPTCAVTHRKDTG